MSLNGGVNDFDYNNDKIAMKQTLQLVCTFSGHTDFIMGVVEKDCNTIVTGSWDGTSKEWNATTGECLKTKLVGSKVYCMIKTRDESFVAYGLSSGHINTRRLKDLNRVSSFKIHSATVLFLCELTDGTYVSSGLNNEHITRWNKKGRVIQTFYGHSCWIKQVIELRRNLMVSLSEDRTIKLWQATSGECLGSITLNGTRAEAAIKLSDDMFATVSFDKMIRVWDDKGKLVESFRTDYALEVMTKVGDTIVCGSMKQLEMRKLK